MTDSSTAQEPWEQPGWLSPEEFTASEGVEDWRTLGDAVYAFFRTDSFTASARLVQAIAGLPDIDEEHQPQVDIRHEGVTVRLTTISPKLSSVATANGTSRLLGRSPQRPGVWASRPTLRGCSTSRFRSMRSRSQR
jgi:pterin-4a-carbinolamine dehydratase